MYTHIRFRESLDTVAFNFGFDFILSLQIFHGLQFVFVEMIIYGLWIGFSLDISCYYQFLFQCNQIMLCSYILLLKQHLTIFVLVE